MADNQEKIYAGTGRAIQAKRKDGTTFSFLKLMLSPEHIQAINNWANNNGNWCTLNIQSRKEPSAKGNTHYAVINDFVPSSQQTVPPAQAASVTVAQPMQPPSSGDPTQGQVSNDHADQVVPF